VRQPGQDRKDRTVRAQAKQKGQPEQDRQNRTGRSGLADWTDQADREKRTGKTRPLGQDCKDRTARMGLPAQGCQHMTVRTVCQHRTTTIRQSGRTERRVQEEKDIYCRTEHDRQNGTARKGQAEQKRQNRITSTGLIGQDC
jgi:hypothetical protein